MQCDGGVETERDDARPRLLPAPGEAAAPAEWRAFYAHYGPMIRRFARRRGLGHHHAEDVIQETMLCLAAQTARFVFDPDRGSMRNFVLTVAHRRLVDLVRKETVHRRLGDRLEAGGFVPFDDCADETFESPDRWHAAKIALERTRTTSRHGDRAFAVFDAYVLQGLPVTEVTRRFGLKPNAIYQVKNRILRRVQTEVREALSERPAA